MITKIEIKNVKGIRHVAIVAKPVNEISGKNGAGKSSVLDSITFALAGRDFVDREALRSGEQEGAIWLETDEFTFERKLTEKDQKGTLTIRAKNGSKALQTDIDKLINTATFDPMKFCQASGRERIEIAKKILSDEQYMELNLLSKECDEQISERVLLHREIQKIGQPAIPLQPRPATGRLEQAQAALLAIVTENQNRRNSLLVADGLVQQRKLKEADLEIGQKRIQDTKEAIKELEERILSYKEGMKAQIAHTEKIEQQIKDLLVAESQAFAGKIQPDFEAHDKAKAELEEAQKDALIEDAYQRYEAEMKALERKNIEYGVQDSKVRALQERRAGIIADALGEGFEYCHDGYLIRYNGVLFDQLSQAEKVLAACKIIFKTNPKIRVVCVRDGSLLDSDTTQALIEECQRHNFQLWIETVGAGSSEDAIVIEEGSLKL